MSAQDVAPPAPRRGDVRDRALTEWGTRVDRAAYACTVLVVLECTLGSSGRWLVVGGISGRNLLLIALLLLMMPRVWARRHEFAHSWVLRLTILALAALTVGTIIGINNGNRAAFIGADITTLVALLLVPGILATVDSRARIEGLVKTLVLGATLLATATFLIYMLSAGSDQFAQAVNGYLNDRQFGGLAALTSEVNRVYLRSSIFFPLALPYVLVAFSRGRHRVWSSISIVALLTGIALSFTRGFLIAAVLAVLATLIGCRWTAVRLRSIPLLTLGAITVASAAFLVFGQSAIGDAWMARGDPPTSTVQANPDSEAMPESPGEQEASTLRELTLRKELKDFTQRPVLGWGLGYNLDGLRNDGRTEYMYIDYLVKLGVVGTLALFAIFIVPAGIAVVRLLRRPREQLDDASQLAAQSLISLLALAVVSFGNPFLNNTMGICVLILSLAAARQATLDPDSVRPVPGPVSQGAAPPER